MEQRYSMVTLGVADVAASKAFYEKLGWQAVKLPGEETCFFRMGSVVLALYGRQALADDAMVENTKPGFAGMSIAWNGRNEQEVDEALQTAIAAGAKLVKPAQKVFWGGYSGYFADPDGHLWEVAHNPFWTIDEAGAVIVPDSPA